MVELVDTPVLGTGIARCGGSSPLSRTGNVDVKTNVLAFYIFCANEDSKDGGCEADSEGIVAESGSRVLSVKRLVTRDRVLSRAQCSFL